MLAAVTREAVLEAMGQCDALGRQRFLAVHGYWPGRYVVRHRRRTYDTKAIIGVAAGLQHDCDPLAPSTFSGGLEHAVRQLVVLGFDVRRGADRVELDDVAIPRRLGSRVPADLRLYVCRPTSEKSIAACKAHGFGSLISPLFARKLKGGGVKLTNMAGYTTPLEAAPYVVDNGVFSAWEAGEPWTEAPLIKLLERVATFERSPEWAVLPDRIGEGPRSLELSLRWHAEHAELADRWLLAVQNGMTVDQVREAVVSRGLAGIFVGGTSSWKWETVPWWAGLGLDLGVTVHVGRVNGEAKARRCRHLGVSSIDGSSVARFSVNATKLARPCDGSTELEPERAADARARCRVVQLPLSIGGE